jgi:hypothetical protein
VRIFYCFLIVLLLESPAWGREIFVDNTTGDDHLSGQQAGNNIGSSGPVRSLAKALQLAVAGDTIVLAKTDAPYRESVSLVGSRCSGTSQQPFVIQGNGAILDGSTPAPAEAWEHYKGAIFRLRVRPAGSPLLFLNDRPAVRAFAAQGAKGPTDLQPRQWCAVEGQIFFCVEHNKLPDSYKLSYAHKQTGITLFHVEKVRIVDLIVQGFQVDGINLSNSAREVLLSGVTCRGNGRNGLVVGGASSVAIRESLLGDNGQAQLLTLPYSETLLTKTHLLSNSAPGWVDQGGRVTIDGKREQGGKDHRPHATPPEKKP